MGPGERSRPQPRLALDVAGILYLDAVCHSQYALTEIFSRYIYCAHCKLLNFPSWTHAGWADEHPPVLAVLLQRHPGALPRPSAYATPIVYSFSMLASVADELLVDRYRDWCHCQAIIYVVDSTDRDRIGISREEFHSLLSEDELAEALILVYANKQVCTRPAHRPFVLRTSHRQRPAQSLDTFVWCPVALQCSACVQQTG